MPERVPMDIMPQLHGVLEDIERYARGLAINGDFIMKLAQTAQRLASEAERAWDKDMENYRLRRQENRVLREPSRSRSPRGSASGAEDTPRITLMVLPGNNTN